MHSSHGSPYDHAVVAHERTAQRHLAVAARWEQRGEARWAEFERQCAALENDLAQLEADRADLERLRGRWLEQPSEVSRAELRHRTAEISRRLEELKARDAALEEERIRLRDERDPIAHHREDPAEERERRADERGGNTGAAQAGPIPESGAEGADDGPPGSA